MNTIIKQVLAFSLSLFLVIAPTIQQANAASSWSITGAVSAGARTIVSATKGGYKSAVNIAPSAVRLGAGLLRVGNTASLIYAASQLGNNGIDFVIDPANNRIKYKEIIETPVLYGVHSETASEPGKTMSEACTNYLAAHIARWAGGGVTYGNATYDKNGQGYRCVLSKYRDGKYVEPIYRNIIEIEGKTETLEKYISVPAAAAQVLKNAQSGNAAAQAAVRGVATEMVVGGQFDQDLLAGAVPQSDNKPLVPAVPGNGNGNVTHGSDVGIGEGGTTGATPGQQADAAKDAADAAKKAAQAAADAAKAAAEAAREAADNAADLVNAGADAAAQAAAQAAAAAAAQAAKDAAATAAAAGDKAAAQAAAAERAAAAAIDAAKAAATQAAADLAAAQAAGDAAAVAAAEAAKAAADAAVADAKAKQAAAEKAAEKAKAEAQKPFELPPFCSWAAPVCDAVDWLMKPAPDLGDDTALDIDGTDVMPVDTDINFGGSCPANFEFNGSIFGNPINIVLLDTSKFCGFLSTFVKFPVYAASSLFALYILGGRKDV